MYEEREEREEKPRRQARKEKLPSCEFCGTSEKAHNVSRKLIDEHSHILCDNPVCNLLPSNKPGKYVVGRSGK